MKATLAIITALGLSTSIAWGNHGGYAQQHHQSVTVVTDSNTSQGCVTGGCATGDCATAVYAVPARHARRSVTVHRTRTRTRGLAFGLFGGGIRLGGACGTAGCR